MTTKYCDYISGNDSTGTGSYSSPYKTITQATIGLTGGDEVRVAKSPGPIVLTGTIALTAGNFPVAGTGTLFTTELVIGDFIKGGDDNWYEVGVITNNTSAALYKRYPGSTQSGVSSQKLGVTSTGAAAAIATNVQTVSVSGTSVASRLLISGGWDLSIQIQTGSTFFRQMHGTFANRYGRGLYIARNYTTVSNLGFLRYDTGIYYYIGASNNIAESCTCSSNSVGIYYNISTTNTVTSCVCNSNGTYGIIYDNSTYNTATSCTCNGNTSYGIYYTVSLGNTATSCTCNVNLSGIYYITSPNNIATSCTCSKNSTGIYYAASHHNIATLCICNSNTAYGIYYTVAMSNTATSCTCNGNTLYGIYISASTNNTATSCTCNSNLDGIFYSSSSNNTVSSCTCDSNTTAGIFSDISLLNYVNNYLSTSVVVATAKTYSETPALCVQRYNNTPGNNRCYYEYGVTYRNTVNAKSGECLEYDPSSSLYYLKQSFYFVANSGVEKTVLAYVKASTVFNGDVSGAIFFLGIAITGWTDITPTGHDVYEQKSLIAAAENIIEDGVLELQIKVRGTAGSVYVDDFSAA